MQLYLYLLVPSILRYHFSILRYRSIGENIVVVTVLVKIINACIQENTEIIICVNMHNYATHLVFYRVCNRQSKLCGKLRYHKYAGARQIYVTANANCNALTRGTDLHTRARTSAKAMGNTTNILTACIELVLICKLRYQTNDIAR